MTIHLPPQRVERLWEIVNSIPKSQRCTSMKKGNIVLSDPWFMAIDLPGARNIFGHLQNAIMPKSKTQFDLSKGSYQALGDFRWIAQDLMS